MRCLGQTNHGTRYQGKVVGDSPEFCRGLDAYGFSDFKRSTEKMRALTSGYDIDDPQRFNFGTPKEVWSTMERCWTHCAPTSARIIADIMDFPRVLEIVIRQRGAVVPEIQLRHGHRHQAINGGRVLKRKVTLRQRKHLLTSEPVHPDAERALQMLLNIGRQLPHNHGFTPPDGLQGQDDLPLTREEIEEAEALEATALDTIENVIVEDDLELEDEDGDVAELNELIGE
jgi:hypothetical protein